MKKITFLMIFLTTISFAQYSKLWEISAGSPSAPWLNATDNSARGIGYDKINNYLYVCSRTGGHNVYVLNADNGNVIDTLSVAGISGGTFNLNLVKVDEAGVIYAANLQASAGSNFKVYRWENKDAVPTVAYDAPVTARVGDAFTVVGSGINTIIYASGTGNTKILVLTTANGTTFTLNKEISLGGSWAAGSISPENNTLTSPLWINNAGTPVVKVNQNGTVTDSVSTGVVSSAWRNIQYFSAGNEKFFAVAGKNDAAEGKRMSAWNVTRGSYFPRPAGFADLANNYNTNGNATSDFAVRVKQDGKIIIYNLITNNGLVAYQVEPMAYFSVNMKIKAKKGDFNPAEDKLFVRGSFNGWGTNDTLADTDNDTIYTKLVKLDSLGTKEFKFMFRDVSGAKDVWESDPNRSFNFTEIYTIVDGGYFDRDSIFALRDSIYMYFSVNMELERLSGRFNPATDSVSVNGSFQGWTPLKNLLYPSGLNPDVYEGIFAIFAGVGENIEFKFFYRHSGSDVWESVANRKYTFTQADFNSKSAQYSAAYNNGSLTTVINQKAKMRYTVNTNGAINHLTGLPFSVVNSVHIAGSSAPLQWPGGGWPNSDSTKVIRLYDDGSALHGDAVAGDKIFSNYIEFPAYTSLEVKYKYGINWGLPENGGGNDNEGGFGADHTLQMTQFMVSATVVDTFGKAGVASLRDVVVGVEEELPVPQNYSLGQNYPNPFNPSTVISYSVPKSGMVTLKVYDLLGSEITTLVNEVKSAGTYTVRFNGAGLSTGIYLYKIQSGEFTSTKKMVLVK